MNDAQRELLRLIAAGETTEDESVLREAQFQSVFSMVNHTSPMAFRLLARNVVVTEAHRELCALLRGKGIPFVVLKGVASAAYYPEPLHRTMGDVDLLVSSMNLPEAEKALAEAGWMENPGDNGKHKSFRRDDVNAELHWVVNGVPLGNQRIEALLADILLRAVERDGLMLPSVFHHGLVLLLHTAEHLLNTGVGLRHLCDWTYFSASIPEEEFIALFEVPLRSIGLWRFAQMLTLVGVRYLGSVPRRWADCGCGEEAIDALIEDILNAGNFGVKDPQRINQAKLLQANGQVRDHALFGALAYKTRLEWPTSQKHPILLPVGMLYVGTRHLFRIRAGKRPPLDMKRMTEGAGVRRAIYRELHLFENPDE